MPDPGAPPAPRRGALDEAVRTAFYRTPGRAKPVVSGPELDRAIKSPGFRPAFDQAVRTAHDAAKWKMTVLRAQDPRPDGILASQ